MRLLGKLSLGPIMLVTSFAVLSTGCFSSKVTVDASSEEDGNTVISTESQTSEGSSSTTTTLSSSTVSSILKIPSLLSISSGHLQSGTVGSVLTSPLLVALKDDVGSSLANVTITWAVLSGGGTLERLSSVTSSEGAASVSYTLGTVPGANTISATINGYSALSVTFSATATVGSAADISISSGNSQSSTVGSTLSLPLVVSLKDAYGNAISGSTVSWAVTSGAATLGGSSSLTNASGVASNSAVLGTSAGAISISATAQGTAISTTFAASAVAGSAAAISIAGGNSQTAALSTALSSALTVSILDSYGNPVSGTTVNWAVTSGSGTLGGATSTSNASGVASNTFTTAATAGAATISATIDGTALSKSFTATGTVCSGAYLTNAPFAAGAGSAGDPYLICTATQLNSIGVDATLVTKSYKLGTDINLSGVTITPIGSSAAGFTGSFDGDNYTLSNLSITGSEEEVGLFRRVLHGATIKNLTLRGGTVSASSYNSVAALIGRTSDIYGNYTPIRVSNVHVTEMTITGAQSVGGVVGYIAGSSILDLSLSSSTQNSISGTSYVGGLAGAHWGSGTTNKSYVMSNVTGSGNYVGGFFGHWNFGNANSLTQTMHNVYATHDSTYGTITGANYVGGLVGYINNGATMFMSFSTAPVVSNGGNVGGLVGANGGACKSCYWDVTTSGQATSAVGVGKTTAQMKSLMYLQENGFGVLANYDKARYDFATVWRLESSSHYPSFQWQHSGYSVSLAGLLPEGSGTVGDPYIISSVERLENMAIAVQGFSSARTAYYKLTTDLDLSGKYLPMIGGVNYTFRGTFDGDSHTISSLSYPTVGPEAAGLFAVAGNGATIKNLTLSSVSITSTANYVGALVGLSHNGGGGAWGSSLTIQNVRVTGATISGATSVGGIVGGYSTNEVVMISSGIWDSTISGTTQVGGLVGAAVYGSYSKVYSRATVTASGDEAGGLIGRYVGTAAISDSYATHNATYGTVTGNASVGGLIGNGNGGGTLARVFASNPVVGNSSTGGLVGSNALTCATSSCFWDTVTSGKATSPVGTGKTTAEMYDAATFTGASWDETTIWLLTGSSYPSLR